MDNKKFIFFLILLFSVNFIVAQQTNTAYGFNTLTLPGFNNNTAFVNSSQFWNTLSLGPLDDVNTTQFFSNGGELNIDESWLDTEYIPYTGAVKNADMGAFNFTANNLITDILFVDQIFGNPNDVTVNNSNFIIDRTDGSTAIFDINTNNNAGDQWRLANNGNAFLFSPENQDSSFRVQSVNNELVFRINTDAPQSSFLLHGTGMRFNDAGENFDFRIETVSQEFAFEVDAGENRIGLFTDVSVSSSTKDFEVNGSSEFQGTVLMNANLTAPNVCYINGVNCTVLDNVTNLSLFFLNLSGGNANQNVDIGAFDFTATRHFAAIGSQTAPAFTSAVDSDNGIYFGTNFMGLTTGALTKIHMYNTAIVVNELGRDFNYRIESDENANMFVLDGGLDTITIGSTQQAGAIFHIKVPATVALTGDSAQDSLKIWAVNGADRSTAPDENGGDGNDNNFGHGAGGRGSDTDDDEEDGGSGGNAGGDFFDYLAGGDGGQGGSDSMGGNGGDGGGPRFTLGDRGEGGGAESGDEGDDGEYGSLLVRNHLFQNLFKVDFNGVSLPKDNYNLLFGFGGDASIDYDPTVGFVFKPDVVGSLPMVIDGNFNVTGDTTLSGNLNITGTLNASLINITSEGLNYLEGNLSVFELIVRNPASIILGGIDNVTGEAFSRLSAGGFNLNLSTQQFGRRVVRLDKDFLMTVNRTNGTIYLASSQVDSSEFAIAITDAVNAVGWGFQLAKMSVNWEKPHLNRLLGHNGEMDIRTTNTDLIAGAEGITIGFMGIESFDADFDITGFNNLTDVIFIDNSFGVNPFLTTFFFDVNFTNQTTFVNITAVNITALDTIFAGDVISQGLFDRIDNVTEINSDVIHNTTLQVLYAADTTNNEITINVTFGTISSFQVWDAERKFNVNSVFVNILNSDGVTIDHSAELDSRNKAFQFYFNGTVWNYGEIGEGQFVAISSAHDSIADFGNLIQESDNHTDITVIGSMEFTGIGIGSQRIISLLPAAMLQSNANWKGFYINGSLLDPTGEGADIVGLEIDFSHLNITNNPVVHGIEITVPPRLDAIHIHEGQLVIDNKPTDGITTEFSALDIRIDTIDLHSSSVWSALGVTAVGNSAGTIAAVLARNGVQPIRQEIGTFTTPSQTEFAGRKTNNGTVWVDGVDGIEIFVGISDEVYLGSVAQFSQIEIIMGTIADKDVQPTFWYNTGADTWTEFFPVDETSGFQSSSLVSWEPDSISALWTSDGDPGGASASTGYWIKIIRVRVEDEGTPTPTTMKTGTVEAFGWDEQGVISVKNLTTTDRFFLGNGASIGYNATCQMIFYNSTGGVMSTQGCT